MGTTQCDIGRLLASVSEASTRGFRREMASRMVTLGFQRARIGKGSFSYSNLKHNLPLVRFISRAFPEKLPEIPSKARAYMDAYIRGARGCLALTLITIPSEGISFYSVSNEDGSIICTADFVDALEAYEQIRGGGIIPGPKGSESLPS